MLTIDLTPRPSMLMESLRSMGYTLETALADVIDNSLAAGARRISVRFLWAGGNPWIAIMDDGRGMAHSALVEAMRFGSTSPHLARETDDLGRFGLGMKTASISQCRLLTVVSWAEKQLSGCCWDMEHLANQVRQNWEILVHTEESLKASAVIAPLLDELTAWKSGTIVCWETIDGMFPDKEAGRSEVRFSDSMDRLERISNWSFIDFCHRIRAGQASKSISTGVPCVRSIPSDRSIPRVRNSHKRTSRSMANPF